MKDSLAGQAAVLVLESNFGEEPEILLTRRSDRMATHSGEVALPGGKWEQGDGDLEQTASREALEEVGVKPSQHTVLGELPAQMTRNRVPVQPFVSRINEWVEICPCSFEIESVFWLPIAEIVEDKRVQTDVFCHAGGEYWAPVYQFEGYKIWGLTARVLVSYANTYYGAGIGRVHRTAKEKVFGQD